MLATGTGFGNRMIGGLLKGNKATTEPETSPEVKAWLEWFNA